MLDSFSKPEWVLLPWSRFTHLHLCSPKLLIILCRTFRMFLSSNQTWPTDLPSRCSAYFLDDLLWTFQQESQSCLARSSLVVSHPSHLESCLSHLTKLSFLYFSMFFVSFCTLLSLPCVFKLSYLQFNNLV